MTLTYTLMMMLIAIDIYIYLLHVLHLLHSFIFNELDVTDGATDGRASVTPS